MNVPAKSEKKLYHSKTVIFNVVAFLILAIPILADLPVLKPYSLYIGAVIAILNIGLRFFGDNPVEVADPTVTVDRTPEPGATDARH